MGPSWRRSISAAIPTWCFGAVLMREEARRRKTGESFAEIPKRPDHGHEILDDIGRASHPGYPFIGRLRGLAELRGVMTALAHSGPLPGEA